MDDRDKRVEEFIEIYSRLDEEGKALFDWLLDFLASGNGLEFWKGGSPA